MYSTLNTRINQKEKGRRRRYFWAICIVISLINIVLIFFIINLNIFFYLPERTILSEVTTIFTPEIDTISFNSENSSTRYIYIDIGCFDGETVEHFLYFTPNSQMYDIFTFEPDPHNYQLCKQRLAQKKYKNHNIIILQKVVWIRDEKVFFRTDRGRYSRITTNKTALKHHATQLDAIDFSSWLARLAGPNKTKIYIKMSISHAEVAVLEKMVLDNTLELAEKYEIEWSDRANPHHIPTRIFLQLMFDNRGFDCLYYTRLEDAREIFKTSGTSDNITKHYDWRIINASDTYGHYRQRPEAILPSYKLK